MERYERRDEVVVTSTHELRSTVQKAVREMPPPRVRHRTLGQVLRQPQALSRAMRTIIAWFIVVSALATVGAVGYMLLEHWTFFDGLYMAVTILTSVGLKEVRPMDRAGDLWTIMLAGASTLVIFGTVGIAAESIATEFGRSAREKRRMNKDIARLEGHYVVCGFGRVGSLVAQELRADGKDVVVLDANPDSRERATSAGFLVVPGDGTSDDTLMAAGIDRAAGFVTAIDDDAANVYATISARSINPELFIVARASTRNVIHKLELAGADRAISPYVMAGRRLVQLATRPGVVDFIDAALSRGELSFSMEEVNVDSHLAGTTVAELRSRGLATMAIRHAVGNYEANPPEDRVLWEGEALIVSGSTAAIDALFEAE